MIHVRFFAGAREAAGVDNIDIEAATVPDLVEALSARFDEDFSGVATSCSYLVDGTCNRPDAPLSLTDGAVVDVLPPFAGG